MSDQQTAAALLAAVAALWLPLRFAWDNVMCSGEW